MSMIIIPVLILISLNIFIFSAVIFNRKIKGKSSKLPFVSFIIPSYNDSDSIEKTIKSIHESYKGKFEILVINDCSKDATLQILKKIKRKYNLKLINNKKNLGKAKSINLISRYARGEIIFMLDSDIELNKKAVDEMVYRLQNKKVGLVTCRYKPTKSGFLESMQWLEYNFISCLSTANGLFTSMGIWGGCMAVKKEIFFKAGKLSKNMICEDSDLAFKVNELGFKVIECSVPVYTKAPDNLKWWLNQKIRWAAGSMQSVLKHFRFYILHPINTSILICYGAIALLSLLFVINLINNFVPTMILFVQLITGNIFYNLLSSPYIFISYDIKKKPQTLFLLFPYFMLYMPILALVSIYGFIVGIYKYFTLKKDMRGW